MIKFEVACLFTFLGMVGLLILRFADPIAILIVYSPLIFYFIGELISDKSKEKGSSLKECKK